MVLLSYDHPKFLFANPLPKVSSRIQKYSVFLYFYFISLTEYVVFPFLPMCILLAFSILLFFEGNHEGVFFL